MSTGIGDAGREVVDAGIWCGRFQDDALIRLEFVSPKKKLPR